MAGTLGLSSFTFESTPDTLEPSRFKAPFRGEPSFSTWFMSQPYGNTVGAYMARRRTYVEGQGVHFGVDLTAPCDTPVVAIGDGTVYAVDGPFGAGPHNVVIQHEGRLFSLYGHLRYRSTHVSWGQKVRTGDVVGVCGDWLDSVGCRRAPHLHLEIRRENMTVATNPIPLIDAPWDDASIGLASSSPFEIDLSAPRRWQTLRDQADIRFGGPLINDYAQPWPPDSTAPPLFDANRIRAELKALTGPAGSTSLPTATGREGPVVIVATLPETGENPPRPVKLTDPGCCPAFEWLPSSQTVQFFDEAPGGGFGIWSVDVVGGRSYFDRSLYGFRSPSGRYVLRAGAVPNSAVVIDTLAANFWEFIGGGPNLLFSPDESQVAYSVRDPGDLPGYARNASLYVSRLDGSDRKLLGRMVGGPSAWFLDGRRLLLTGRERLDDPSGIWIYDLLQGTMEKVYEAPFIRRVTLAPNGRLLAFARTLEHDPSLQGPWILDVVSGQKRRIEPAGGFRWHASSRGLIVIPPRPGGLGSHRVWWVDAGGKNGVPLTSADSSPLRIANFEWDLSPDGRRIVYRSADDLALWTLDLGRALDSVFAESS